MPRWRAHSDGTVWQVFGEGEELPQRFIDRDRKRARDDLRRDLFQAGVAPSNISRLAERVIPERVSQAAPRTPEEIRTRARESYARNHPAMRQVEDVAAMSKRIDERRAAARARDDGLGEAAGL